MLKNNKVSIISLILLVIVVIAYLYFFEDITNLFQSGLENIIFGLITFILLTFIVTPFISKEKQKQKKKEAFEIVEHEYNSILTAIGYDLYAFLTKEPYETDGSNFDDNTDDTTNSLLKADLETLKGEVEQYFTEDFFERNPIQPIPDETQEFTIVFQEIDIELFMDEFSKVHRKSISDFVSKYKSELPDDLKMKLYSLERSLGKTPLFAHFPSLNINNSLTKLDTDYEVMKKDYKDILNQVIDLLDYFSDYEKVANKSDSFTRYKVKDSHKDYE